MLAMCPFGVLASSIDWQKLLTAQWTLNNPFIMHQASLIDHDRAPGAARAPTLLGRDLT
jgi:hypothetical protein